MGSLLGRRIIVIVLVLVLVHDFAFAYPSSCTGDVYRSTVNGYDLPASQSPASQSPASRAVISG